MQYKQVERKWSQKGLHPQNICLPFFFSQFNLSYVTSHDEALYRDLLQKWWEEPVVLNKFPAEIWTC